MSRRSSPHKGLKRVDTLEPGFEKDVKPDQRNSHDIDGRFVRRMSAVLTANSAENLLPEPGVNDMEGEMENHSLFPQKSSSSTSRSPDKRPRDADKYGSSLNTNPNSNVPNVCRVLSEPGFEHLAHDSKRRRNNNTSDGSPSNSQNNSPAKFERKNSVTQVMGSLWDPTSYLGGKEYKSEMLPEPGHNDNRNNSIMNQSENQETVVPGFLKVLSEPGFEHLLSKDAVMADANEEYKKPAGVVRTLSSLMLDSQLMGKSSLPEPGLEN